MVLVRGTGEGSLLVTGVTTRIDGAMRWSFGSGAGKSSLVVAEKGREGCAEPWRGDAEETVGELGAVEARNRCDVLKMVGFCSE